MQFIATGGKICFVDERYKEIVEKCCWNLVSSYPLSIHEDFLGKYGRKSMYLHHIVMIESGKGLRRGKVDHINQNPRDNTIENLRDATTQQNNQNRSANKDTGRHGVRKAESSFRAIVLNRGFRLLLFQTPDLDLCARFRDLYILLHIPDSL